jgi:transposase
MKRLPDPVQKINAWVLGLDLHKRRTAWVLLDRKGHHVNEGWIDSRPEALRELYRRVIGRKKAHVAFEAGGSSLWAFDTSLDLVKDESRVHAAHPKSVKAIANSTQKNDRNDAWWLAYLTYEQRLPEGWIPRERYRELRVATRERTACVQEKTRVIKRIHAHMRQAGRALSLGALNRPGGRKSLRATLPEFSPVLRAAIEHALGHIEDLSARILAWEATIQELVSGWDEVTVLKERMPGIQRTLAAVIVAESGPFTRFVHPKAYGRYSGLTPWERTSAGKTRFGKICKEGNAQLRWALTQAAAACLRTKRGPGVAVGNWIRARQRRLGSCKKALVAAARKLAEAIWRLFALGECFDLERMFGRIPASAL